MPPSDDVGMIPEAATLPVAKAPGPGSARPSHVRYIVLSLTIAAYMITYIDRVVISSAVPSIQKEFGFSIVTMGWILSSFQWAYALFQIPGGWLGDRIGPRRALTLIVTWWSLFTCATVLAWSAASMALIRFLFGMGEAGAFPIATRSLSRWMLPTERGLAQGATHAGSRLGGALTPALVVLIIARYGWRTAFLCCGSLGLIWAAVWYWYYRNTPDEHRSVNAGEREQIRSALELARGSKSTQIVPWKRILRSRQMWILSAMYFCYAYNLSVYLVWFPKYLNDHRGFNLQKMGFYASLLLLAGTLGDIFGGCVSDFWAKKSNDLKKARRLVGAAGFLVSALAMVPACLTKNPMTCVWLSCVAIFALESTVGVSWAITLDIGGDSAGSVCSVMNTCGNLGGAIGSALSAYLVVMYGWNAPFLLMAGLSVVGTVLYTRINANQRLLTV
jgi:MFS transporter, ACS family, glucarate transporter